VLLPPDQVVQRLHIGFWNQIIHFLLEGDVEGAVDLAWEPTDETKSYTIDPSSACGAGIWTSSRVLIKSIATADGLTVGQPVWRRIAVGAAGQERWSDAAMKTVQDSAENTRR
jgi:hypothetical protein